MQSEEILIENYKKECVNILKPYIPNIYNIDLYELSNSIQKYFYNYNVMNLVRAIICLIMNDNKTVKDIKIHNFFTNISIISLHHTYGYLLKSDLGNNDNFIFTLKYPRDNISLNHEYFIGLHINKLRKIIPNFIYTYGSLKCTAPYYIENLSKLNDNKVISWCHPSNNDNKEYIVYELIPNSETLYEYLKKKFSKFEDVLNIYIQVIFSLYIAKKELDFKHYRLDTTHVIIRNIEKSYIQYTINNKTYYLLTDKIATIINFTASHIKINNTEYNYTTGNRIDNKKILDLINNGNYELSDAYNLLLNIKFIVNYNNIKPISNFITLFQHLEIMKEISNLYNFIDYILGTYKEYISNFIFEETPDTKIYKILQCNENCENLHDIINKLQNKKNNDLNVFYELVDKLKGNELEKFIKTFVFDLNNLSDKIDIMLTTIKEYINKSNDDQNTIAINYNNYYTYYNTFLIYKKLIDVYKIKKSDFIDKVNNLSRYLCLYRNKINSDIKKINNSFDKITNDLKLETDNDKISNLRFLQGYIKRFIRSVKIIE